MTAETLLTTTEASRLLGISSRSIQRMCRNGRVRFFQYDRKILIPDSELSRFLNNSEKSGDKCDIGDKRDTPP